ncbi:MAG: type II toxin-antitoxin system prevent-host-death family antitoxin [Hyphomicrobiales bacterium]|nr:type II toxin-antitoxin system prevent-host-death family antitoxin [Hyphomicrobiales bacterium]MDE2116170.1 type II toxin-antitoxin system prevent-host-death family antitoxin [Hyphomicrobiales bacterium]
MTDVSVAQAKAHFSALVDKASSGELVGITRRGKLVAQIVPVEPPRKPINLDQLRALTNAMPRSSQASVELVHTMRDQDRY